ncbi:MAG TPA: 4-hydroxy-3-methylbut-2-enyl diphosphate reductase [Terriglobia bacterium]|nr:4-hydroxy-3-methylbut-2-enyl diphosphate reductase [Terriglobia bacterium]
MEDSKAVLLPKPRGFCAGVIRAIDIVEIALERLGAPVYVRKEIVHNRFVVDQLAARGAVFVDSLSEVPDGAVTIYSAHGVAPDVREDAERRKLRVIDATCPLVTKVHIEVIRYAQQGYSIVLIGHQNHDEVIGTYGEAPGSIFIVSTVEDVDALELPQPDRVIYATQTTLSLDDTQAIVDRLKERFPAIISPASSDICYATQNRQIAVKTLAEKADLILVVGAENSSNSNRLVEVARVKGTPAYLIASARDIRPEWLAGHTKIGVTAGASTPEILVQQVVEELQRQNFAGIQEMELIEEDVHFPLPAPLDKFERVKSELN